MTNIIKGRYIDNRTATMAIPTIVLVAPNIHLSDGYDLKLPSENALSTNIIVRAVTIIAIEPNIISGDKNAIATATKDIVNITPVAPNIHSTDGNLPTSNLPSANINDVATIVAATTSITPNPI